MIILVMEEYALFFPRGGHAQGPFCLRKLMGVGLPQNHQYKTIKLGLLYKTNKSALLPIHLSIPKTQVCHFYTGSHRFLSLNPQL